MLGGREARPLLPSQALGTGHCRLRSSFDLTLAAYCGVQGPVLSPGRVLWLLAENDHKGGRLNV